MKEVSGTEVIIQSKDIQMVDIEKIVPNPKNANRHSIEQIERLVKLIKYQGFRNPLIVSKRTGKKATLESTGQTYEELCNERK